MEILFEQDNEEKSVASLILDALVKVGKSQSDSYIRSARYHIVAPHRSSLMQILRSCSEISF